MNMINKFILIIPFIFFIGCASKYEDKMDYILSHKEEIADIDIIILHRTGNISLICSKYKKICEDYDNSLH